MQYNHSTLLKQMVDKEVPQQKIIDYFVGEGYPEAEVISEINDHERQKELSASLTGDEE